VIEVPLQGGSFSLESESGQRMDTYKAFEWLIAWDTQICNEELFYTHIQDAISTLQICSAIQRYNFPLDSF
jgi:hypothetical protein